MHPIKHFKTITHHKILVAKYCFRIGLYRQGLTHDLSKYSPTEFWAGAKYYQGDRSTRGAIGTIWNTGWTTPETTTARWTACVCRKSMWPR